MRMYPKHNKVTQYESKGVVLSWNPDDNRFYVSFEDTWFNYKDFRNAAARYRAEVAKR